MKWHKMSEELPPENALLVVFEGDEYSLAQTYKDEIFIQYEDMFYTLEQAKELVEVWMEIPKYNNINL